MSDGTTVAAGDVLRVLVVGDSSRIDATVDALESAFDPDALFRERTISAALERLAETDVHCIVCEFDPAGDRSQLAALEDRTDVPIVAVTDGTEDTDGSEGIDAAAHTDADAHSHADGSAADRALAAGATDVVEPDDPRTLVVTRIRNAAQRYRLAETQPAGDRDRRYRSILESSDALVLVLEADGGIEYASSAVEARLGYTSGELERTTIERIVHPKDREDVQDLLSAVAAAPFGATERASVRVGDSGGTWRIVDLSCVNRTTDPLIDGVVVTISGAGAGAESGAVTAETDANDVRAATDRLAEPFFALGPDWELRYANPAATRLFDAEPGTGTVVWELLPDRARESFADRLREARETEAVVSFDVTLDERRFAVTASPSLAADASGDIDASEDGVSVLAREVGSVSDGPADVDRLRERERDRLELLESTIDALDDGVAVLEDGTVRLSNTALFELTGATTLVGREIGSLFDEDLAATIRERAQSPVVRWMEPVDGDLVTERDGPDARRPVDVYVTPLSDDDRDRTLCVIRDRQRSATGALAAVCRTIATLRTAEARSPVREAVTDGIRVSTDAELAAWYLVDEDRFRPAAVATADASPAVEPPPIDRAGIPEAVTDRLAIDSATVYDRSALEPLCSRSGIRAERVLVVPVDDHGVVLATSTEPLAFEALDLEPMDALADAAAIALDRLSIRTRVRECQRERSRLASLVDRTERIRDIEHALLTAETRAAVEQQLCDGVLELGSAASVAEDSMTDLDSASAKVELAWVGHVATGSETVTAETWAGRDGTVLESASVPVDPAAVEPTGRTAARRESTVVEDLEAADRNPEREQDRDHDDSASTERDEDAIRDQALERGFRSALSVPIEHDAFQYGTLTAYATGPSAFDEDARAVYEHLALVAGHAIGALERKRALLADSVVELEVLVRDESEPLSALARRVGSRIDVRSVVPRSAGGSTVFCTVADWDGNGNGDGDVDGNGTIETIRTAADELEWVESIRLVGDDAPDAPIELVLSESTVAATLAEYGGVLRSITPVESGTRTRLVIDLASTVDVRSFVRSIDRTHPGTELVARRERDRSSPAARAFDSELRDRLSERQLRTLEAAYYGGFFDWPRESTGEDVADSLGVSQPTFSRHLRLAQRKLFELLFDDRTDER